jgi:hypothetical protein
MIKNPEHIFLGSEQSPFLAPRGICVHNNYLLVCDTAQNRIFIWKNIPSTSYAEPDIILGNQEADASALNFKYPSGIWTNGSMLVVADAWNHRVLIWHHFPTSNYALPDVVIGQTDFSSVLPNQLGVNHAPSSSSLYWPYGVFSDGISLWIADTGNRRILYYKTVPTKSSFSADEVIGQDNMESRDLNPLYSTWPYSVKIDAQGGMIVADTQYFRVLYWKSWKNAMKEAPSAIWGQDDIQSNGQNQYRLKPTANSLSWNYDALIHEKQQLVFIADTGNSRILSYPIEMKYGSPATTIYGQNDFESIGENKESIMGLDNHLYWPFSIAVDDQRLFVCETGNNRIFIYQI